MLHVGYKRGEDENNALCLRVEDFDVGRLGLAIQYVISHAHKVEAIDVLDRLFGTVTHRWRSGVSNTT